MLVALVTLLVDARKCRARNQKTAEVLENSQTRKRVCLLDLVENRSITVRLPGWRKNVYFRPILGEPD